jgi:hypothetical protein
MSRKIALPCRGDFITLEAPRERSAVAICVGHTGAGSLRVRRVITPNPARTCFESMATYRGAWRPLPVTDPRHPAFDPTPDATLAELGL